jgi:hypothetical protein
MKISYKGQELGTASMQVIDADIYPILLGNDWLLKQGAKIDYGTRTLTFNNKETIIPLRLTQKEKIITLPETDEYEEQQIIEKQVYFTKAKNYIQTMPFLTMESKVHQEIEQDWDDLDKEVTRDQHEELTAKQQKLLDQLLEEYRDLFAEDMSQLGKTDMEKHRIPTTDDIPVALGMYRYNPTTKQFINEEVERMLKAGVIEESTGSWAFPVVVVTKKGGKFRLCINYKKLNDKTITDKYPMPRIDDIFDSMQGANWFSSLDLASGYWQVEVEEQDRPKTAFRTDEGFYQFKRMPFGLKNAPASFQKLMNKVLKGFINKFAQVYIDDINVYSKTFEDHISHLRQVFERIREAGLRMQRAKCSFIKSELEFLGHTVSRTGLKVDPKKIDKVKEWPKPRTVREVRQFMGLVNYYRRFVQDLSKIGRPLYALTKEGTTFKWGEDCETAFQLIKELLCSTQVMSYPNFNKPFRLTTDASKTGLGAILEQEQDDGTVRPIAFASKSLLDTETRYTTIELELYAVKWGVKHFRHYLMNGKKFEVYTDHRALAGTIKHQDELSSRVNKWLEYLTQYEYTVTYIKGRSNKAADALSRKVDAFLEKQANSVKSKTL